MSLAKRETDCVVCLGVRVCEYCVHMCACVCVCPSVHSWGALEHHWS